MTRLLTSVLWFLVTVLGCGCTMTLGDGPTPLDDTSILTAYPWLRHATHGRG
jgi:hypothetical protein